MVSKSDQESVGASMIHVGFTGTREGMTEAQMKSVMSLLMKYDPCTLHHGDCVGADAQANDAARWEGIATISHPPKSNTLRAFCIVDDERDPKPYLTRNKDIVDESDRLIAAPETYDEQVRSGTWSTVRYARLKRKRVFIVYPNGKIDEEMNDK